MKTKTKSKMGAKINTGDSEVTYDFIITDDCVIM